jgi:uncharacterized protein YlxP (DUF503 family)
MVIGILQFDLFIHDARSIKDKRRVLNSLKDRLHRQHLCSVAEVGNPDLLNHARIGIALVSRDGAHAGKTLDRICAKLHALVDARVGDIDRQIIGAETHGPTLADLTAPDANDELLRRELLDYAADREEHA